MRVPPFLTGNHQLDTALSSHLSVIQSVSRSPILSGILVSVTVEPAGTSVAHGLGRPWQGWIVVAKDADARIWDDGTRSSTAISLTSSTLVNVTLWIF